MGQVAYILLLRSNDFFLNPIQILKNKILTGINIFKIRKKITYLLVFFLSVSKLFMANVWLHTDCSETGSYF